MKNVASLPLQSTTSSLANPVFIGGPTAASLQGYAFTYLVRGSVVLTAALSNYILEHVGFAAPWLPWMVLMPMMSIIQTIRARRQKQQGLTSTTATDSTMRLLQKSFLLLLLVAMVCACFVGWEVIHPLLLIAYGVSTYVAGRVLRFRSLQWGGVVCGVLGAMTLVLPEDTQLLFIAAAMLGSYIIPGYLLRKHSQA
ncbi:hypothetical protein [Hymenobacter volaticus]|uniref:Uncharacterized protein n=1 Tax=Hymenobacter volaticus TaxID=2932254 RepID=A0ABY4G8G5_9BACT|nr:hypothetical protein [Hymenobacter volaticus]UOQ66874.1 hypothetical protein MUN86_02870 [Hymenobacter volaticus]